MAKRVNIYEAKAKLSSLVANVATSQEPVIICRNNVPVVDLVPHREVREPLKQTLVTSLGEFNGAFDRRETYGSR